MPEDVAPAAWAPDACTLPTADRPVRSAEFDAVFGQGLWRVSRLSGTRARWEFAVDADQADRIGDLLRRETECCSFFTFTVTRDVPGLAVVDVAVPAAYTAVLDALNQRAACRAGVTGAGDRS
jgi:hypothetical protein